MYNNPYRTFLLNKEKCSSSGVDYIKRIYGFECRYGQRYIIWAEHYPYDIFAIKFFLHSHSHSQRKFKVLTGLNDPFRVFATCVQLMVDLKQEKPLCSFGFIATSLVREEDDNTKRLQVYRKIMEALFSPTNYIHYIYEPKSAYLLLNRSSPNEDSLKKVEKMFTKIFDFK